MTAREIVLEQIRHRETAPVPYTLTFEDVIAERLDKHYGAPSWRDRLAPYMVRCANIDRRKAQPISDTLTRDLFGTVWREDKRPFHLQEPGLVEPLLRAVSPCMRPLGSRPKTAWVSNNCAAMLPAPPSRQDDCVSSTQTSSPSH